MKVGQKAAMQPGGGQIEFQSWKAIMVLLLQILLRTLACLLEIPVFLVNLCILDKSGEVPSKEISEYDCGLERRFVLEEECSSYMNPLFGQDWTSESFCEEEILLAERMTSKKDKQIVPSAKDVDRQPAGQRRKALLPVRAVAKKKPPPKPQRVWR